MGVARCPPPLPPAHCPPHADPLQVLGAHAQPWVEAPSTIVAELAPGEIVEAMPCPVMPGEIMKARGEGGSTPSLPPPRCHPHTTPWVHPRCPWGLWGAMAC